MAKAIPRNSATSAIERENGLPLARLGGGTLTGAAFSMYRFRMLGSLLMPLLLLVI